MSEDRYIEANGKRFMLQSSKGPPKRGGGGKRNHYPAQDAFEAMSPDDEMFIPLRDETTLRDMLAGHESFWAGRFRSIAEKSGLKSYARFDRENGGVWFGKVKPSE